MIFKILGRLGSELPEPLRKYAVLLTRILPSMVLVPLELPAGRALRTLGPIIDTPFEDLARNPPEYVFWKGPGQDLR